MEITDFIKTIDQNNTLPGFTENRFILPESIINYIKKLGSDFTLENLGKSVSGKPIFKLLWGKGDIKVMLWSQMHGNETTTTRALIRLLHLFDQKPSNYDQLKNKLQLLILPIVNPDGAIKYSRYNANMVDLNRDAKNLSQPESKILMKCFWDFKPDYCLNLHDQRSIFGVNNDFAGMSFLAPAFDDLLSIDENRKKSMQIIAKTAAFLKSQGLNNNIGRYDDTFNAHCFGDFFQMQKTPTILVEAGQMQLDYNRDLSTFHCLKTLFYMLNNIAKQSFHQSEVDSYFHIPTNEKYFLDLRIENVLIKDKICNIHANYDVKCYEKTLFYFPRITHIDNQNYPTHRVINAEEYSLTDKFSNPINSLKIDEHLAQIRIKSVDYSLY
jgi:hypothetical protein